jgi:hypothetical protein
MDKYIGQYRVLIEKDLDGKPMEGTYIKCAGSTQIYRYDKNTLVVYATRQKGKLFVEQIGMDKIKDYVELSRECQIFFDEMYIDEVAKVVKASTRGKNVKPKNKRNYKK